MSSNIEDSIYRGINKVNFTPKLDINEPPLTSVPIYRILTDTGEIVNNCNSIIVSNNVKYKNICFLINKFMNNLI